MKKVIVSLGLALILVMGAMGAQAAETKAANPIEQFTGVNWQQTSPTEKLAFFFGIDTAVASEYFLNSRLVEESAKAGKKPVYTLSPFERGWMKAFENSTRDEVIAEVDKWYAEHPDRLRRPVLAVIWYEIIEPRLAEKK